MRRGQILRQTTEPMQASEKGFSLVIVLFFIGLIASLITLSTLNQRGAVQRDQAEASGWYLAQVAKAARIYVRDRSLTPASQYHKTKLAAGGIAIPLNSLRTAGLLPPNFPSTNGLSQTLRIYAANYPVNGVADSENTFANAYVFLQETTETAQKPELMQHMLAGAKKHGLIVEAPIFNDAANVSELCNSAPAVALWDTGCLNLAEFTKITTRAAFTPGSVMVPAWRSEIPDTRAVMRFPQTEHKASATMLTSLEMAKTLRNANGNCSSTMKVKNYVKPTEGDIDTGLCNTEQDELRGIIPGPGMHVNTDKRYDLINVTAMNVDTVVAAPQKIVGGGMIPSTILEDAYRYDGKVLKPIDEYERVKNSDARDLMQEAGKGSVLYVSGRLTTAGNVWATGNEALTDGSNAVVDFIDTTGSARRNLRVYHNIAVERNMNVSGNSSIGQASVLTLDNDSAGASTTIAGRTDAKAIDTNVVTVNSSAGSQSGMIANSFTTNAVIEPEKATFFSPLAVTGTVTVKNKSQPVSGSKEVAPGLIVYRAQGAANVAANSLTAKGSLVATGAATLKGDTSVTQCFGGTVCPDITPPGGDVVIP